ncbi:MAG: MoxR family ATPase [Lachnospiraceae bacterium]|nr:MoxR family ATPase [Lachnospiraceae bacterium]MBQ6639383.1 MoxR family ATPase [Lachnospiraceae bacterium]
MSEELSYPTRISTARNTIKLAIHGKDDVIDMVLCAIFAGGHILLEDIPGVGKTTLVTALAKVLSLNYRRVQFTPDVLPSDILGFTMYDKNTGEFSFREGAVYTNLFLADEINRTSPKTQSALLEVMEEGRATVDGVTRELSKPFMVIATQNPIGASGTQKLPESQLDRFMVRLSMGYPGHKSAVDILKGDSHEIIREMNPVIDQDTILEMQRVVSEMYVSEALYDYAVSLTEATRNEDVFTLGLSPRGSISLLKMAKAHAFLSGRTFVTPEDFREVFLPIAGHRVLLSTKAKATGQTVNTALLNAFATVPMPRID